MAPQSTGTKASPKRALPQCRARAASSLPVPLSPSSSTGASLSATARIWSSTARSCGDWPRSRPMPCSFSTWARRRWFSRRSRLSSRARFTVSVTSASLKGLVR